MTDPAAVERLILVTVALAETALPGGRWITAHEVAVRAGLWPDQVLVVLTALCASGEMDWTGVELPEEWTGTAAPVRYHLPLREVRVGRRGEGAA